jgi:uncharacterized protein (TIGR02594 family)
MAPRPQVSIRLATDGKAQVVRDFGDVGDAGDVQAKRISAAYNRAATDADSALARVQKAAARMASIAPTATGATNMVNPITGGSYAQADGRAQASAAAIAASYDQADASARRLLASVDPLYAAQMRYDAALQEAIGLQKIGALTADQLAVVQTGLKKQLDDTTLLYGKHGEAIGNTRIAQMELMHVVRGSVDQFAAGAPPMQIFTMHLGMLGQAAALSGESMGKFGAFMASGWGLALTVAVVALGPLIGKLVEAGSGVDALVGKLRDEAHQQALNDEAHKAFAKTLDGAEASMRALTKAMDDYDHRLETTNAKELDQARALMATVAAQRAAAQATLDRAKAEGALAYATNTGSAGAAVLADQDRESRLGAAQAELDRGAKDFAFAQKAIDYFQSAVTAEQAQVEGTEKIKKNYDALIDKARRQADLAAQSARAAGDQAKAQALVTTELNKQVQALVAKRDADIKAYEDAHRKGPKNAGGEAIFDAQIASFFDTAAKYRGLSEHSSTDRGVLEAFFREANLHLDPEKTAWCAAFVNAVLAAGGVHGTGSLAAKSFLTFGKDDTKSPQKGDIAVVKTGAGDHVGFVDSVDKAGNVRMLAGNTSDKVGEATYSKNQVLAIRRPPTPSESAAAADKAASDAITQQQAFDSETEKLNQQYLQALGKVVAGYDAQATVQLMRAQGEHDAQAQEITANLAAGKYGDATSDLAQKRAQQLQIANDQVLAERKAAIGLDSYVKSLRAQDSANEQNAGFQLDALRYQESIARTAGERKDLGKQIIDIEYDEKKKHLEYLLALDKLTGNTEDAAKVAADLANLPKEKGRAKDQNERDNRSPLQKWAASVPQSAKDIGDALESMAVKGIDDFNAGLAEAIVKGKSLKDVFHGLAEQMLEDLIKLVLKQAELAAFKALFGSVGRFATGTESAPGGTAWVGEHGPELVSLPRGSKVYTAADSRRMAANENGPMIGSIEINADFRGAAPEAVDALQSRLDQLEADLPGRIVATYADARDRFVIRR